MTRTRVLAALLAGLTLAGVGTAATALGSDDPATAAPVSVVAQTRAAASTGTPTSTATAAAVPATIAPDDAGSRAVTHLGGGTVTTVERETEHGRTVWKVDVRRDTRITEVHVDTATGAVTHVEDDDRTADDRNPDDRTADGRGRDDRGRHGGDDRRHGSDDGPGHDRFDDKGGDR